MTYEAASPGASGTPMDLIGKTVRWEGHGGFPGRWFTARVIRRNEKGGYVAEVVDAGNFNSALIRPDMFGVGHTVPDLRPEYCTVIDSEPVTEDEECE